VHEHLTPNLNPNPNPKDGSRSTNTRADMCAVFDCGVMGEHPVLLPRHVSAHHHTVAGGVSSCESKQLQLLTPPHTHTLTLPPHAHTHTHAYTHAHMHTCTHEITSHPPTQVYAVCKRVSRTPSRLQRFVPRAI
jgi:hypothetical protein